jgi:hypothetical protein
LIVDDTVWADLVAAGIPPDRVTGYGALDLPRDVGPAAPATWTSYDLVLSTESLRTSATTGSQADEAVRHSVVVATFGRGDTKVEIRRIDAEGARDPSAGTSHDTTAAARQGAALSRNPSIDFAPAAQQLLTDGKVDVRVMTTLVALAVDHPLQVTAFPADPAETAAEATPPPRRIAELQVASSTDAEAIAGLLRAQQAPYRPAHIDIRPDGHMTVTYEPAPLS